jgi:poly-gamma-glutamate system protein
MIRPTAPHILVAMTALALLVGAAAVRIAPVRPAPAPEMLRAATIMAEASAAVRDARVRAGIAIDAGADPNRTGLIGLEWSPITTTLGALSAKRTTTNPNVAAGLVRWLRDAGVRERSVVAIGASGSFPGLIIATVAAAQALGAEPLVITSTAASTWGANDPRFTWMDIETALVRARTWPRSLAASLGGDGDGAADLTPEARALLRARIDAADVPLIGGASLRERIAVRMAVYDRAAASRPIAAFVNVGGASANVGTCPEVLRVRPGVHRTLPRCSGEPGVMWVMQNRGVPVIHLLHVDGVAAAFGLPIDPVPLPAPGRGAPFTRPSPRIAAGLLAAYVAALIPLVRRARAIQPSYQSIA